VSSGRLIEIRQKRRQQPDERQVGAQPVDELDAGRVGEPAERGRSEAAHAEREAEEDAANRPDPAGDELLRVHEDRGERRREDQSDRYGQDAGPEQVGERQREGEREHAEDGSPDHPLRADPIADRPAENRPRGDRAKEHEQVQLRARHRDAEAADQVERVIAAEAREIEILREDQHRQHEERAHDAGA